MLKQNSQLMLLVGCFSKRSAGTKFVLLMLIQQLLHKAFPYMSYTLNLMLVLSLHEIHGCILTINYSNMVL